VFAIISSQSHICVTCICRVALLYAKMDNDFSDAEDVSLTPDAVDDSCIMQFIEIVPLDTSRNDFAAREVKDEFTEDIKQEPEDLHKEYRESFVNVCLCLRIYLSHLSHG